MSRHYPVWVENPAADLKHFDTAKKLIEMGTIASLSDLTCYFEEVGDLLKVVEAPSITTVSKAEGLGWGFVYSAVKHAKAGLNFKDEWKKSAEKGTKVHEVAESIAQFGILTDEQIETYPEELRGYITGVNDWFKLYKPKVLKMEFMTFDFGPNPPLTCVAGRADLFAIVGGNASLIDYKTVKDDKALSSYPKAYLANNAEIAARAVAMEKAGTKVDQCIIVRISPTGKHHSHYVLKGQWQELHDHFMRMVHEHHFRESGGWN